MLKSKIAICVFLLAALISGCATIKEGAKCAAGVSTRVLEDNRKDAVKKQFNYDYNGCYAKVKEILTASGAYFYAQDKNMLAIYVSREDTTPVGVFFMEIDAQNTEVEVSSPSTYAKEYISGKIFSGLEKEKGKTDAEK